MTDDGKYEIKLEDWSLLEGNEPDIATISQYKGNDEIAEIPSVIDDKTIVGIGGFAFYGENTKNIKKIIIPDTVQVIYEEEAFNNDKEYKLVL